jgi:hypothetical protein
MQLRREMLQEIREGTVNLGLGDHVVVVQDEEELLRLLHECIDQCVQQVSHGK